MTRSKESAAKPELILHQATYPIYQLPWEKLHAWLKTRFPQHEFEEQVKEDHYVIYTPEPLKQDERDEIASHRDQGSNRPRRPSHSSG